MKDQTQYIHDKIKEARDAHPDIDPKLWDRLDDFLWDSLGGVDLKPFVINRFGDGVGVWWDHGDDHVWALFSPHTTDWEWSATTVRTDGNGEGGNTDYTAAYGHKGMCSFTSSITGEPHYFFPDDVERIVSTPDKFKQEYHPMLMSYEYNISWVTNKYDGMLSGYGMYQRRLHYIDMVEETDYQRRRMYAVYQLTPLEQLVAYLRHVKWTLTLNISWAWKLYTKWHRLKLKFKRRGTAEEYWAAKNKFRQTHKVVGYFER